ncbi:MAG: type IX secretion system membrane protein PorP/SprF [Bacteroidia bacterium]|nr:type IX secretion system membrane protein PorP/SprF [Bacteroidia bacterium]
MKRSLFLCCLMGFFIAAYGQQESHYTQYMFNRLVLNPAFTGVTGGTSLTALYRAQWVGFEGAPRTYNVSGHTSLGDYRGGIGLFAIGDKIGPFSKTTVGLNYAYRFALCSGQNPLYLSFGIQGAVLNFLYDRDQVSSRVGSDPALQPPNNINTWKPDFGAGIFLHGTKGYVGISAAHIVPVKLTDNAKLVPQIWLLGGYDIDISDQVALTPSAQLRYAPEAPVQLDASLTAMFANVFWAGINYRLQSAVGFLAGVQPLPSLRIGYAYDWSYSPKAFNFGASHEIFLSYTFRNNATPIRRANGGSIHPRYF